MLLLAIKENIMRMTKSKSHFPHDHRTELGTIHNALLTIVTV